MKSKWLVIALIAVLGAAFCVQATSTWKLGERQHLADLALPALVVLLEVGSITAATIFFSARSKGLRVRALLMLAITAGLGGGGGVIAYGFAIGIPVAVLMLGLVEVVGAYRHEKATEPKIDQPSTVVAEPVVELVEELDDDDQDSDEEDESVVEPEPWRNHRPTEAEYAATILDHLPRDGQRLTQQEMLEALRVVSPDCSLYRVKQYRRSPLEVAS